MKARVVFLANITKKLRHKSLGFCIYGDSKENAQAKGEEVIKYKAGEVYLVWHHLPHIPHPFCSRKRQKGNLLSASGAGSKWTIYTYAESAVACTGAVSVATCTGLLVKNARTMATTRRAADK